MAVQDLVELAGRGQVAAERLSTITRAPSVQPAAASPSVTVVNMLGGMAVVQRALGVAQGLRSRWKVPASA